LATALNAQAGQWIAGTSSDWAGTKWFSIKRARLNKDCTVTFTLREVPSDLEDWTPSTDELNGYSISLASGGPPNPLLATGINPIALSALGADGTVSPGLSVTYTPVDDPSTDNVVLQIAQVLVNSTTGYSNSTATFQDPTGAPFSPSMVGKTIVIAGAGPSGAQYSDTIAGYTSATLITLTDPTSTTGSNLPYQVLSAPQEVTADDASDGIITATNLLGGTLYAYRLLISGLPGRSAVWSDWSVVTTTAAAINAANLINGTLTAAAFASTIRPVEIASSLPSTGNVEGRTVVDTADGQLYRFHAGAWTNAVPAVAITGQLTASQIASITAAQLTGQITTTQISPGAITTPLLGAGCVQTANLYAGCVVTASLASGSVTTPILAAGSVTTPILAVGSVTATNMAVNSVVAGTIASGAINTSSLILNGVVITAHLANNAVTKASTLGAYTWTPSFADHQETNLFTGYSGGTYLSMPAVAAGGYAHITLSGTLTRTGGRDPIVTVTIYAGNTPGTSPIVGTTTIGDGLGPNAFFFAEGLDTSPAASPIYSATIQTASSGGGAPVLASLAGVIMIATVFNK
jgi:hypothetical protein